MKQFSAIIIGAGGRGETYTSKMYQMPDKYKIVGMADPREIKRKRYQDVYGLSPKLFCRLARYFITP